MKNVQYNPPQMALRESLSFFLGGGGLRHGTVRECRHNFSVLFFFYRSFSKKKKKRYGKQLCAEPIKEYKSARICCNVHLLFFSSLSFLFVVHVSGNNDDGDDRKKKTAQMKEKERESELTSERRRKKGTCLFWGFTLCHFFCCCSCCSVRTLR